MSDVAPRTSRLDLSPGDHVRGTYRLEKIIGVGGFGEVWQAEQLQWGEWLRNVALKLFSAPERAGSGESPQIGSADDRSGWLHETRTVMQLGSVASVPHIYEVGVDPQHGVAFLAMELLEGEVLEARLARGPIPWRRALAIAGEIAEALVACHARGITHCDLKPQNVFLTDAGRVVVLDFGIASVRGMRAAIGVPLNPDDVSCTVPVADEVVAALTIQRIEAAGGTIGYMAPEQLESQPPDPGADVYALGVVLYRMLAGGLPYRVDASELSARSYRIELNSATIQGARVPLRERAPHLPAGVATLVESMLVRQPQRLRSDELLAALAAVGERPYGIPAQPYADLDPFGPTRAGWLPGREADIERVVESLRWQRAVVLLGPSGAGKSSLAQAGVAARLDSELLDGTDGWETIVVRPSAGPRFLCLGSEESATVSRIGRVVIIDQLEEVLGLGEEERGPFCAAIRALTSEDPDERRVVVARGQSIGLVDPVRVIATLRDVDFATVAELPELRPFPEQNLVTVSGLDPTAAEAIVVAPLRALGVEIEDADGVVAEVAEMLRVSRGTLPLIQLALSLWWDRDGASMRLTAASWNALGGVLGALHTVADELYGELGADDRALMRAILVELFRADRTRQTIREDQLPAGAGGVLAEMHERWLVRWRQGPGGPELAAVHEALSGWPELDAWLTEAREAKELIEDARRHAARWRSSGRPLPLPESLAWGLGRVDQARQLGERLGEAHEFIAVASEQATVQQRLIERALDAQQRWRVVRMFVIGGLVIGATALGYFAQTAREEVVAAHAGRVRAEQELADKAVELKHAEARTKIVLDERRAAEIRASLTESHAANLAELRIAAFRRAQVRRLQTALVYLHVRMKGLLTRALADRLEQEAVEMATDRSEKSPFVPSVKHIPVRPY